MFAELVAEGLESWRVDRAFSQAAYRWPDRTALEISERPISYRELEGLSNRLAHRLLSLGITRGDFVAVAASDIEGFVIGALAILKAGAAYLPIDLRYSHSRARDVLAEGTARLLLADPELPDTLIPAGLKVVRAFSAADSLQDRQDTPPQIDFGPNDPAYLCYTSGSTGEPKGVVIGHAGIEGLLLDPVFQPYRTSDRVGQATTFAFDATTLEVWGTLLNGGCLVGIPKEIILSPMHFVQCLERERISSLWLTTSHFNAMVTYDPATFQNLDTVMIGGEAADPEILNKVFVQDKAPRRLINGYGPTEATTLTTWHEIGSADTAAGIIPIGKPLQGRIISVRDADMQPVPHGQEGELCISGPAVAHGYLGDSTLTGEKFIPDPTGSGQRLYRTGDLCRKCSDGSFVYLGRIDEQVKIRGFRVELGGVSTALSRLPSVEQAAVLVREKAFGTRELVGFVRGAQVVSGDMLRSELSETVQDFMLPSQIYVVESFPLTASGKLDRIALLELCESRDLVATNVDQPATDTEEKLLKIWQDILRRKDIGIHQEFHDLGGDSLNMMALVLTVEAELGKFLAPEDFPPSITIASLAAVIDKHVASTESGAGSTVRAFLISIPWSAAKFPASIGQAMGNGRPFMQLQVPPSLFTRDGDDVIGRMVTELEAQIMTISPQGPYVLGGFSFSGLVAYELASRLRAAGHEIELLVLIDSYFGGWSLKRFLKDSYREYVRHTTRQSHWFGSFVRSDNPSAKEANDLIAKQCKMAMKSYRPQSYCEPTLVLRSSDPAASHLRTWDRFLIGDFTEHVISGDHMSLIKKADRIRQVAHHISSKVSEIQRAH